MNFVTTSPGVTAFHPAPSAATGAAPSRTATDLLSAVLDGVGAWLARWRTNGHA
jgi:hypothetical protein